ncbi:restriction endonuclease subunit S [Lactococcus garvieae]|uniref:restriction endonuclease subunit S n=1 Tax=Lactococcus garvieae TaxID=1363 RepID=UPI001A92B104|nr:restriction endonuclease subunit S [Lactococcus garvieae]MCO7128913.1 restriction endonuclease subunit S [Lactococcus garvieae]QSQ98826.1 restriction endonuclease subunit S [Lactococcus garvieae]
MKEKLKAPELRFSGFTDDWEEYKLGDLLKYEQPTKYIVKSTAYDDDFETPVLTAGQSFVLGYTNETDGIKYASSEAPVIIFDDFTTGSHYVDFPFKVKSSAMKLLRLKTDNEDFSFIYNTLKNINYVPKSHERHWISKFSEFKVSVPTIDEQVKIGTFFKNLDALITIHQRKLDLLKEQKKGYLQKMFPKNGEKVPELRFAGFADDWEEHKVSEITDFHKQGFYTKESYNENKKYYLLRGTDMTSNKLILKDTPKINASEKDYEDFKVLKDDFLIVRSGTVGTYAIVKSDITAIFGSYLINFRFNQSIVLNEFFGLFYQSSLFKSQLNKIIQKSSNVNINAENIKSTNIKFPTIEEQQKIGAFFQSIDDTIALHQRKLDLLKEQKKGFLQQMFI